MEPTSSQQKKTNSENVIRFPATAQQYKMYSSEQTTTKIDASSKNIACQNFLRTEKFPSDTLQNPEIYQMNRPMVQNSFGDSPLSEAVQKHDNNINLKPKHQQPKSLEQTISFPEGSSIYNATKSANSDRIEGDKFNSKPRAKFERDCEQNLMGISRQKCNFDQNHQIPNKKIIYQNRVYDIATDSSYICQPIDNKRDTVRINDLVVKDKLVLCCKPRTPKSVYIKPNEEESGIGTAHGYTPHTEELIRDNFYEEKSFRYGSKSYHERQIMNLLAESDFQAQDPPSLGASLFIQEHNPCVQINPHQKHQLDRKKQCTELSKKFKSYLWALFLISVFIVIIGLILLFHTLSHFIWRNYINIVIEQTGFVIWVWIVMIFAVSLVIVGVYGIITSIDRGKRILTAFCTIAAILAFLILIFLLFLWVLFINMKDVERKSMKYTLKSYRCSRYIRNAWDDLQETHKCCGIEDQLDWKYIPPSCCNATSKLEKVACVKHYITENQAFDVGCKSVLGRYFFIFFITAAFLLFLAFILLVLAIFACLWLMERYKKVEKCQEVYYVSR